MKIREPIEIKYIIDELIKNYKNKLNIIETELSKLEGLEVIGKWLYFHKQETLIKQFIINLEHIL